MAAVTLLSSLFNTSSGTKTTAGATPAVGDLIVIITAHTGNTSTALPSDSKGGVYEFVGSSVVKATSADTMRVYIRTTPISSATSTTFSHAPGTSSGGGLLVFKVTGMTRTGKGAIRVVSGTQQFGKQDNQAAATPAPALPASANTNNPTIGAVFNATNPATMTPPTNWTERGDLGYATPTTGIEGVSRDSGFTGTTVTWGSASGSAFCSVILELDTTDPIADIRQDTTVVEQSQSMFRRQMPTMFLTGSLILGTLSQIPASTDVPRGPLAQGLKTKPEVTALAYPNLVTLIPVDNPVFTQQVSSAPQLVRNVEDTSYGMPKALFDDAQLPVGTKNTYTQPDRIRPVWDTSRGTAKALFSDSTTPFANLPSLFIPKLQDVHDTSVGTNLPLIPVIVEAPFVPYDFSNVQKPQQILADTSKGVSKVFLEEPVVEPPFIPAPHLAPIPFAKNNVAWIWRPEGAPDPAPAEQPIGARALEQVEPYRPPVWAQNFTIPPDVIPVPPPTPIPEGKQALTFSPHKRPQVFAEQHYIPPYLIVDSSIAVAAPESLPIVRKPRTVTDTSFRNEAILNAVPVVAPTIPWNFEKPQQVRRDVVNTSAGTPKTLIRDAQLPVGQPTPQSFIAQKKWQSNIQIDYRNWNIVEPVAVTYTITPSGGITFSGTVVEARERTYAVSGSVTFSGTNEFTHITTYAPTGAITLSGTNPVTFLPGGAAPATTRLPMTGAGQT